MKSKFTQDNLKFKPIDITITLETPEDLRNFLIMASALSDPDSFASDISDVELNASTVLEADVYEISNFVDSMVDNTMWRELKNIYLNTSK